ncbi:hypothetical protein TNCV_326181 [Trichonephila clavipes]|nr:hypothetical protein TNCV_326181 [Trichonephila clavipes]
MSTSFGQEFSNATVTDKFHFIVREIFPGEKLRYLHTVPLTNFAKPKDVAYSKDFPIGCHKTEADSLRERGSRSNPQSHIGKLMAWT